MLHCMDRGRPEDCETFAQLFTEDAAVRVPLAKVRVVKVFRVVRVVRVPIAKVFKPHLQKIVLSYFTIIKGRVSQNIFILS